MGDNPKNILYLNSSAVLYGAENRLLDAIRNLDRSRYRLFALLPDNGPFADKLKELGVSILHLEYTFHISRSPLSKFLRLNWDFMCLVRKHKIDLIHANLHMKMSNFWLAFLILRKPVIVHLRSHYWTHIFEKFIICRLFKVICVSQAVKRAYLQRRRSDFFMGQRSNQAVVIYDGIDIEKFSPKPTAGEFRREFHVSPQDFLVSIIGAIDLVKGQDVLVQAAAIVIQKHPHAKFVIVGEGYEDLALHNKYYRYLIQLIKDLSLEGKVIFTGFRHDIDMLMNEIDLLVQPSEREALGTSMVEAMSCGKPVIGTAVDGIPEVIGDNEGGMLFSPRNPQELAKAINFFIENPDEARKRGLQGRARVLKMFDARENVKRIHEVYEEALNCGKKL